MINPLRPTRTAALAALLLSFATAATAQSDQTIPWHHMAYEVDGVPGIALPQARIMLSEDVPAQRVKVAVLDCGVDATHPALAGAILQFHSLHYRETRGESETDRHVNGKDLSKTR